MYKRQKSFMIIIAILFVSVPRHALPAHSDSVSSSPVSIRFSEDENITIFSYHNTRFSIQRELKGKNSVLGMQFNDRNHQIVQINFPSEKSLDLSAIRQTSIIRFRVKGAMGGEQCCIGVVDNGNNGTNLVEVKFKSSDFFTITDQWKEITLPVSGFTNEGERWLDNDSSVEYATINWSTISSIRFSTNKEQNYSRSQDRIASISIDDLEIITGSEHKPSTRLHTPWKLIEDSTTGPKKTEQKDVLFTWLDSAFSKFTSVYTYGDPTDFRVLPSTDTSLSVVATYMNDGEWSGVTLYRNKNHSINLTPYYESGGIEFYVKGARGGEMFSVGLLDDESDGVDKKVLTRFHSRKFVKVSREWQKVQIPFAAFESIGRWWHTDAHYEVVGNVDWSRIAELRFLVDKYENKSLLSHPSEPVKLYFSSIRFLKKVDVIANEIYWKSFRSDASDVLVADFNDKDEISKWRVSTDPTSTIKPDTTGNPQDNSSAVALHYKIGSWGSAFRTFSETDTLSNWSHHNSITFDFYSSEKSQSCMVMLLDAGEEAWTAHFEAQSEWQQINVPFSRFRQFDWWQPDSAVVNGKMDMQTVRTFDIRPGVTGRSGMICIDNLKISNTRVSVSSSIKNIRINQMGYLSDFPKRFSVIDSSARTFVILNDNQELVYKNSLSEGLFWKPSGEFIKNGDFSGLSQPGTYTLTIVESGESCTVSIISPTPGYRPMLHDALRAFYFQRASVTLPESFAGQFKRAVGHPDTACSLHVTTQKQGIRNVSGGWYDAGDYGKYIVNAGITCATLLSFYSLHPEVIGDSLNIPESKNGVPDILDEIRYELEWMQRMQDDDGGVFFKAASLQWSGFVMPWDDTIARYIIGKSTTSTLNFAAVMAQAARVYKNFDNRFSNNCLKQALKAWTWAQNNPSVSEPPESGGSGSYSDSRFEDEFFWAACELYTTTKKSLFKKQIKKYGALTDLNKVADWQNTGTLGWLTLASNFPKDAFEQVKQASINIRMLADKFILTADSVPYRIASDQFVWGSNSIQLNHAVVMCYAYKNTGIHKYLLSAIDIINYLCGNNAVGYSFITGYGTTSPMQPHHRIMVADGIDAPIAGFLVGGPNASREDELSSEPGVYYPFKEPARCYTDRIAAYASNEICINWNAPLVFVLGFLTGNVK